MKKIVLIMPMLILISGCANTRTYWSHRSNSQQNTYRDIADCEVSANRGSNYSYRGDDEVLHAINEWQSIDRRTSIFNNCMMGKGYYKVTEQQRKQTQQSTYHKNTTYKNNNNTSCDEMPIEEWGEHDECVGNYKELENTPLKPLKYQDDTNTSCDEMSMDEWIGNIECMENYNEL